MEKSNTVTGASTVTCCAISFLFAGVGGFTSALFCILLSALIGGKDKLMKNLVPTNEYSLFADSNGVAKIDSLTVAAAFNKDHRNVIRDIRNLDCSEEFRLLNFEQSSYYFGN